MFVEISDPKRPDVVGLLPAHTKVAIGGLWKDIKVYGNHAFIVSESEDHGMQVFDLTQLRGGTRDPVTFEETAHYARVSRTHNLSINTDTGYAYLVSGETCSRGLQMVDVPNPTEPAFASTFTEHGNIGNIHDTQCVIYEGPDTDYQGREICFKSSPQVTIFGIFGPGGVYNTLSIVDVTHKKNPRAITNVEYAQSGIAHQGWLTPDQGYFLHGGEYGETFYGINTRTRIWDVRDLDDPRVIGAFDSETAATDHNIYTAGDRPTPRTTAPDYGSMTPAMSPTESCPRSGSSTCIPSTTTGLPRHLEQLSVVRAGRRGRLQPRSRVVRPQAQGAGRPLTA